MFSIFFPGLVWMKTTFLSIMKPFPFTQNLVRRMLQKRRPQIRSREFTHVLLCGMKHEVKCWKCSNPFSEWTKISLPEELLKNISKLSMQITTNLKVSNNFLQLHSGKKYWFCSHSAKNVGWKLMNSGDFFNFCNLLARKLAIFTMNKNMAILPTVSWIVVRVLLKKLKSWKVPLPRNLSITYH